MKKKDSLKACPADEDGPVVVHPALKGYFTYRFYKLAMRLRCEVNEELVRHNLISPQLGILRVLDIGGPATQVELGRSLGIDKASMVKMLDGLEKQGWIRREAVKGDRRVKNVCITKTGLAKMKVAAKVRQAVEDRFFAPLTSAEREALDNSLTKLIG